jgi:hypothetical protein
VKSAIVPIASLQAIENPELTNTAKQVQKKLKSIISKI